MGSSYPAIKTAITSAGLKNLNLTKHTDTIDPPPTKKSSTSSISSSPESPLYNPFHDDDKSSSSTSSSPDHKLGKAPSFSYSIPKHEPYKKEAPSVQVMENPTSSYMIPSSVFATSTSKAGEWSVASNDSLFSIHMGNMSFTKDYYSFKMRERSAEGEAFMSGQSVSQSCGGKVGGKTSRELGEADARRKEVIQETEDQKYEKSLSHHSDMSSMSTQSFAFPM